MIAFDPERGAVIASPPGDGPGHWAGAPGAWREGADLLVSYRLRRPHPDRGYETRIVVVRGDRVETLWRATKEEFGAESIERSALVHAGGVWRFYVSYVDLRERTWRIALLESATPAGFDADQRRIVLHPDATAMSAVKDPWLRWMEDRWFMFVSCGRAVSDARFHYSGDALSTGAIRSESGLATSADGIAWSWEGIVLAPSDAGWDRSTARLTAAVRDGDGWAGCYDGAASLAENYEERCGLARSADLRHWERVSLREPAIGTARGPGGVRYVDITESGDVLYEYTRADGAHELRALVAG